jgi:pyruvate/2-oxoglutarate dehydrogenase complex dihydrolipoamide dehydrogenase (E3) component
VADQGLAKEAARHFKKQGIDIKLGAKVSGAKSTAGGVEVTYADASGSQTINVDKLIVCVGRRPYSRDLLGDGTGVQIDDKGFIKVDDHCKTTAENVWAVGDCVRGPMLAHKAKDEGVMVGDMIAGKYGHMNYDTVPSVIYTAPEIAWVGQTEEQVKASGRPYKIGQFPFAASGRARAMESTAGFVKLIAAQDDDEVLGVHIIGPLAASSSRKRCWRWNIRPAAKICSARSTRIRLCQRRCMRPHSRLTSAPSTTSIDRSGCDGRARPQSRCRSVRRARGFRAAAGFHRACRAGCNACG